MFGGAKADFTGAGALGCPILAFVAAQGWGRGKVNLTVFKERDTFDNHS